MPNTSDMRKIIVNINFSKVFLPKFHEKFKKKLYDPTDRERGRGHFYSPKLSLGLGAGKKEDLDSFCQTFRENSGENGEILFTTRATRFVDVVRTLQYFYDKKID